MENFEKSKGKIHYFGHVTTALENNAIVLLEALSVGTPVIGTNAGGLGEVIGKVDEKLIFRGDGLRRSG